VWAWKWVYQEPVALPGIPGTHNYACKQADDSALTCDDDDDGDCRRLIAQKGYLPSLPTYPPISSYPIPSKSTPFRNPQLN